MTGYVSVSIITTPLFDPEGSRSVNRKIVELLSLGRYAIAVYAFILSFMFLIFGILTLY